MRNLNEEYQPYQIALSDGVPTQSEWNEVFRIAAKMHAKYWNDPTIKQ